MGRQANNDRAQKDHHSVIEGKAFWQYHIDQCQKTTLNRKAYCRAQKLNYNRFQYWFYKLIPSLPVKQKSIPVILKPEPANNKPLTLCTLELGKGKRLLIHDISIVNYLLEK